MATVSSPSSGLCQRKRRRTQPGALAIRSWLPDLDKDATLLWISGTLVKEPPFLSRVLEDRARLLLGLSMAECWIEKDLLIPAVIVFSGPLQLTRTPTKTVLIAH